MFAPARTIVLSAVRLLALQSAVLRGTRGTNQCFQERRGQTSTKSAVAWTPNTTAGRCFRGARVTKAGRELGAVVCMKATGMKEA
jgi:hypothetical protein